MVDLDAALGEQLFDVAVGEAKAEVPTDRQHDHIRREAETGEGRPCRGSGADAASSHDTVWLLGPVAADATVPAELMGQHFPHKVRIDVRGTDNGMDSAVHEDPVAVIDIGRRGYRPWRGSSTPLFALGHRKPSP